MQWSKTSVRRKICKSVFHKLIDPNGIEDHKEVFQRYSGPWENEVKVKKAADHFHGIGCHFLQSSIGLTLPYIEDQGQWKFSSLIEYKVSPLPKDLLPCSCMWRTRCSTQGVIRERLDRCPFYAKGYRRFDLCWIETSLLDNVAITAEVETKRGIEKDLGKLYSVFRNSTSRDERGYLNPIVHVQLDLSGKNSENTIIDFMKGYFAEYKLSPAIIYICQKAKFSKWTVTYFHRGKIINQVEL